MKKLTFKVSIPKEGSLTALIKDVNNIPCRMQLDLENGFVTVENLNNTSIDTVIELIYKYYTLLSVDIDNCTESDVTVSNVEETISVPTQTESVATIKNFESPSENDILLKKVEVSTEKVSTELDSKKDHDGEMALLETLGSAFGKLDSSKKVEEQIDSFLTNIGMITTEEIVKDSFVTAYVIKKITYETIIHELHNIHPNLTKPNIKAILKKTFKEWLTQYPELAKQCPRLSFMTLLKAFTKKFA